MRILSGLYKSRQIQAPKGKDLTRPTPSLLRKVFFDTVWPYLPESIFLDLFAGSGVMGFEAISRGAQAAYLVDNSSISIQCIQKNKKALDCQDNVHVVKKDAISTLSFFKRKGIKPNIVYIDPPYHLKSENKPTGLIIIQKLIEEELTEPGTIIGYETHSKQDIEVDSCWSIIKSKTSGDAKLTILKLT